MITLHDRDAKLLIDNALQNDATITGIILTPDEERQFRDAMVGGDDWCEEDWRDYDRTRWYRGVQIYVSADPDEDPA